MEKQEHHFKVEDAIKYGVEKAIILYHLRFWITKNVFNRKHLYEYNGENYFWTYNSARAFGEIYPYFSQKSIARWLSELEKVGAILTSDFNEKGYDRTHWYSLPEFKDTLFLDLFISHFEKC